MRKDNVLSTIWDRYFNPDLDLRVQVFNLLGFVGTAAGIIIACISALQQAGISAVLFNLIPSAVAVFLLCVAGKQLSYRFCCWVIVIGVFMVMFPVLFFSVGGYRSGMPCFFLFALLYTAMMLERRDRIAALVILFALYTGCPLAAYFYPEAVTQFTAEAYYVSDVVTGVAVAGALLLFVVMLHIRMYHARERQIKELNRELAARNDTLERYNKMKTDFLAAVAHEIRTPLDFIVAGGQDTLDLLEETPLMTDEIADNQRRIKQRALRIDAIVMDLMDTVAIENGRLALSRQPMDLAAFLESICGAVFKNLDQAGNRIAYDFAPKLPYMMADPARMEQVMTNLISNAVRHTRGGVITVKLTRSDDHKQQTVSVTDNGDGMDAAVAEHALKQYVSSSTSNEYWRHGVGLYLCRQIITAHGGEIWIDSKKGRGTAVSFSLTEEPYNA